MKFSCLGGLKRRQPTRTISKQRHSQRNVASTGGGSEAAFWCDGLTLSLSPSTTLSPPRGAASTRTSSAPSTQKKRGSEKKHQEKGGGVPRRGGRERTHRRSASNVQKKIRFFRANTNGTSLNGIFWGQTNDKVFVYPPPPDNYHTPLAGCGSKKNIQIEEKSTRGRGLATERTVNSRRPTSAHWARIHRRWANVEQITSPAVAVVS